MPRSTDSQPNVSPKRSKSKKPRPTYHHGDLRAALVRSARTLLASGGPAALTLRAAARDAGVSQTAPYRHFASRDDMLAAVAEDGFRRLHARMVEGVSSQRGKRALQQIGRKFFAHRCEARAHLVTEIHDVETLVHLEGQQERGIAVHAQQRFGLFVAASDGREVTEIDRLAGAR